ATRSLDLLRPDEALDLFVSAAGRGSASALSPADRAAAERIVAALGQHTLAVKLAGAYAAAEQRDMGSLAQEFAAPAQGLALPGDDETPEAVRRTLALSLETLPLEAQRLFTALAAFATPEFGRQATLALGTALGLPQPNRTLHLLLVRALADPATNEALPAESDRERLRLHTLLRALAVDLFGKWPTADQDAASLAVAQTLAAYAEAHQTALVALGADEGNLSGALEWANAHDDPMLVAQLAHGMRTFWDMLGRLREGVRYLAWGVAAAEATQLHDTSPETRKQRAELDLVYGKILGYSGQYEDGEAVVQRSLAAFRAAQERRGEGAALSALGETAVYRGQYEAADDYLQQSLAIRREFFDRQGEGVDLGHLGSLARLRGQFELAEQYLEQALAISREVGDRFGEATAVAYLGQVTVYRRQFDVAERYLEQALIIDREVGDRQGEGVDLRMLGQIAIYRRQPEVAERYLEQALAISREVGDRLNEAAPQCLMGQVALLRQQFGVAQDYEEQAVAISRETGDRRWEAKSLCVIGRVAEAQTDLVRAETFYRQSLAFATELDLGPEIADAQLALGRLLAERLERRDEGCPLLLEAARRYAEMGMPEAEEARAVIAQVGCAAEE
ncbi:MAG TPA: tetratricopeptide repeat protein, partial [Ktedonobacterales bacterium]|nr:tetratricopeptide repeat protein [Ktedonobacterales bacterium]